MIQTDDGDDDVVGYFVFLSNNLKQFKCTCVRMPVQLSNRLV